MYCPRHPMKYLRNYIEQNRGQQALGAYNYTHILFELFMNIRKDQNEVRKLGPSI